MPTEELRGKIVIDTMNYYPQRDGKFATVDLGPLSEGWRTQPDTAAYGVMHAVNPQAWDQGARPASAVEVAERAVASRRPPRPTRRRDAPLPPHRAKMSRPTATTRSEQP